MKKRNRAMRPILAIDQLFNVLLWNGSQDETISSRIHRRIEAGKATWFDKKLCCLLKKLESEHCMKSEGEQILAMKTRKCKCCGKKFENRICGGNYCMECTSEALKIDKIKGIKNENNLQKNQILAMNLNLIALFCLGFYNGNI